MWGSPNSIAENPNILGRDAVFSDKYLHNFRKKEEMPLSSSLTL